METPIANTLTHARKIRYKYAVQNLTFTRFIHSFFLCCVAQVLKETNMLQAIPLSYTPDYLVRAVSPLAQLNPNACPRFPLQMAFSGQTSSDTSKCSYRRSVKNFLLQHQPHEERDRRRQVFLDKVRQVSADKKWESRSEQVRGQDKRDNSMIQSN